MLKSLQNRSDAVRRGISVLLIVQLLVIMVMAVCPELHEWVHHGCDSPDHECAVTLFAHGGCDAAPLALVLVVFLAAIRPTRIRHAQDWVESLFLSRRVLEHAPPAFS